MKKLFTILTSLLVTCSFAASGVVLFSDNFVNNSSWNITSGNLIVSANIASTEGNADMTTAFANFSQALGAGDILQLTFNSNNVTNFATSGWAGISLYTNGSTGTEQIFIGSPGNMSSWGIDGAAFASAVALSRTSAIAQVKFTYNYDTGAWSINVSGETASGFISPSLAFKAIRIGADIDNLADIAVSNLNVVTNSGTDIKTACTSYNWINGTTYTSDNITSVYVLVGQAVNGGDSISTLNLAIAGSFSVGDGTAGNPYYISSKMDLKRLSENPCLWDKTFVQISPIVFVDSDFQLGGDFYNNGEGFLPIGNLITQFIGAYYGQGHIIKNLRISASTAQYVGLFGVIGVGGYVANVGVENAKVAGPYANGVLCGVNQGGITQCYTTGLLKDNYYAGGLVGLNQGNISNCYSLVTITNVAFRTSNNTPKVFKHSSNGAVFGAGGKGGLIGEANGGSVSNCYAAGSLFGLAGPVGGFIGAGFTTVSNCFWDVESSGRATSAGGVGVIGKTTLEMQTQSTFTNATWDFIVETANGTLNMWKMGNACTGNGYPVFTQQQLISNPTVQSLSNAQNCGSGQMNLFANSSAGTINWYDAPTGGNLLQTGGSFLTPILTATTSYWAEANDAGCLSLVRTEAVATVKEQVSIFAVSANTSSVCEGGSATITLSNSESGADYYLRNNFDNSVLTGPVSGTGTSMNFLVTGINSATTYNVYAERLQKDAIALPANNDYVNYSNPFENYTNELTVEAWYYSDGVNHLWAGQGSLGVDAMSDNVWLWHGGIFFVNDNGGWKSIFIPTITAVGWIHLATVINSTGMYIYQNGILIDSNTQGIASGIMYNPSSTITLGVDPRYPGDAGRNSNMAIDNFKVWNKALTATEISNNYQNCLIGNELGLVFYSKFNEGTGINVSSTVGAGGTVVNPSLNWTLGSGVCGLSVCDIQMTDLITVTINTVDTSVVANNVVLTANATGATYQWLDCNNGNSPISGETIASFTATANGSYAVEVTQNACTKTSSCYTINSVGLMNRLNEKLDVTVYPNPSKGIFVIDNKSGKPMNYVIVDVLGKVIQQGELLTNKNTINLSSNDCGMYFIKTNANTLRIIKQD